MMSYLRTIIMLLAVGKSLCNPLPETPDVIRITSVTANLEACKAAVNCEIYDAQFGKAIRFVAGMEPGTEAYNATVGIQIRDTSNSQFKRASGDHSNVQMGSNVMNYGAINPWDALNNMYSPCQYSSCTENPYYVATKYVQPLTTGGYWGTYQEDANLILHPTGQYNGWDARNNLIEGIKQMTAQGQTWADQSWESWMWVSTPSGGYGEVVSSGSQWEGTQSDYFSINHYSSQGYLLDFMTVWLESAETAKTDDGCDRVLSALGAAIGAINGVAGGFFGLLNAIC